MIEDDPSRRRRAEEQVRDLASRLTMAEHEERRRIAQVLHDDLQQRLYSVQMRIGTLMDQALAAGRDEMVATLQDVEDLLVASVELTHNLTMEISPPILEHEGITEALELVALHMKELHGLDVRVSATGRIPTVDDDMSVFVVQVVRELLFNVVKHADTGSAEIVMSTGEGELSVEVGDAGVGLDVDAQHGSPTAAGGLGLSVARERLALFGGRMDIESSPRRGTTVTITIPVRGER